MECQHSITMATQPMLGCRNLAASWLPRPGAGSMIPSCDWNRACRVHAQCRREAGFSDEAVLHAVEIVAYFAFVNRLADGLGVELEK
jgi:hypothetical protein